MKSKLEINLRFLKFSLEDLSLFFSDEQQEKIRLKIEDIFENYQIDFNNLLKEILNDAKKRLELDGEKETQGLIYLIDEITSGDVFNNLYNIENNLKNNFVIKFVWNNYFYDENMKKEIWKIEIYFNNFKKLLYREAKNYFDSNKNADINLLIKEKNELLIAVEKFLYKMQVMILEKLKMLAKLSILNQFSNIKSNINVDYEKIIKNLQLFEENIKKGTMNNYYKKFIKILDNFFTKIIYKFKK